MNGRDATELRKRLAKFEELTKQHVNLSEQLAKLDSIEAGGPLVLSHPEFADALRDQID